MRKQDDLLKGYNSVDLHQRSLYENLTNNTITWCRWLLPLFCSILINRSVSWLRGHCTLPDTSVLTGEAGHALATPETALHALVLPVGDVAKLEVHYQQMGRVSHLNCNGKFKSKTHWFLLIFLFDFCRLFLPSSVCFHENFAITFISFFFFFGTWIWRRDILFYHTTSSLYAQHTWVGWFWSTWTSSTRPFW